MRFRDRRTIALILVLLLVVGLAGHRLLRHFQVRHHHRAAESAVERRDFRQASLHLNKCLEAWPDDLAVRLLAAQTARRQGDYDQALQHLRVYEQNNGSQDTLKLEHQLIRMQRGDLEEGAILASWLDHPEAPETPSVLEALIEGSLTVLAPASAQGATFGFDTDKGAPYLARARKAVALWLRLRPGQADQVQGLVWRGRLHHVGNDHPKALADLRQALASSPDHFGARLYLAIAVVQEVPGEAASHLEMLRQREPKHKHVRFVLANARRLLGELEEARELFDELLADYPDEVTFVLERGLVDLDAGRPKAAERWLRRALALAPNEPEVNLALSRCLRGLAQPEEASRYQARFQELEAARKR
jgi:predicted Zn-dependent protease